MKTGRIQIQIKPQKITNYLCACLHVCDFVNLNIIRCQSSSAQHITLVNLIPLIIICNFFPFMI